MYPSTEHVRVRAICPASHDVRRKVLRRECRSRKVVPSAVRWGDAIKGSARELLARAEPLTHDDRGAPQGAAEWPHALLSSGSKSLADVQAAASDTGWAWRTVQRAMSRADVVSRRDAFGGSAIWSIRATSAPMTPLPERGADGAAGGDDSKS